MEIAIPTHAPTVQDARALYRSRILRQEKLSRFSQGEPDLHPGGPFSDIGCHGRHVHHGRHSYIMPQLWFRISPQPGRISTWGKDPHPAFLIGFQNWHRTSSWGSPAPPHSSIAEVDPSSLNPQKSSNFWLSIAGGWRCVQPSSRLPGRYPWKSQRLATWTSAVGSVVPEIGMSKVGRFQSYPKWFSPK